MKELEFLMKLASEGQDLAFKMELQYLVKKVLWTEEHYVSDLALADFNEKMNKFTELLQSEVQA